MNISINTDPLCKYTHIPHIQLEEMMGTLPYWLNNPEYAILPAKEAFDEQYPFGLFEMEGGEILDDGTFKYPEDPDLHPVATILRGTEVIHIYPYAIVAILDLNANNDTFITRMD